jgi:hypothetical protein
MAGVVRNSKCFPTGLPRNHKAFRKCKKGSHRTITLQYKSYPTTRLDRPPGLQQVDANLNIIIIINLL